MNKAVLSCVFLLVREGSELYVVYTLIFAGQIFHELSFGRVLRVLISRLAAWLCISIIQKYIHKNIFCEGRQNLQK